MKQTAVEWLVHWISDNPEHTLEMYIEAIQQANKIFEKQISHSYTQGKLDNHCNIDKYPNDYYNETFKNQIK